MIEQLIGNYKILEKLSEREMITVYKAVNILFAREVVIKVLRQKPSNKTDIVEAFRFETATLMTLKHSSIPKLHSFFAKDSELFMVLEFLYGETLDKVLKRRRTLPCKETIQIFMQVLDGIEHAHKKGIIHGNLNLTNIMLTDTGTLKILGFGIAEHLEAASITRAEEFTKAQEYLSPEQIKGREADAASDIYALGAMLYEVLTGKTSFDSENRFEPEEMDAARLYEILTGKTPFNAENKVELKEKQIGEMLQPLRAVNPDIPEKIEAAVIKALAQNPGERFQTASQFLEALVEAGIDLDMQTGITDIIPQKSAKQPSQSGQSLVLKEVFQEPMTVLLKTPSKRIFNITGKIKGKKIKSNRVQVNGNGKSGIGSSILRKPAQRYRMIAGATIFAVISTLFISQFIFFQGENHQSDKISASIENEHSEKISSGTENEQSGEVKTEHEVRNLDTVTTPTRRVSPIIQNDSVTAPPRKVIKKKGLRKPMAERLRRAERILTGV